MKESLFLHVSRLYIPQRRFPVLPHGGVPTFPDGLIHLLQAKYSGHESVRSGFFSGVVAATVSRGQRRCDLVQKSVGRNESSPTGLVSTRLARYRSKIQSTRDSSRPGSFLGGNRGPLSSSFLTSFATCSSDRLARAGNRCSS